MPNNLCSKTTSCSNIPINIPVAKVRKKDVQTITDPWTPVCQRCLERENSKVISTTTIDINEYTKALNYINSIHSLLNESLSKQYTGNGSTTSLKTHFSMPDLPNFLTVFSCLTSSSISVTTANKQSNTSNNHMIARATSTSSISNCTFNVTHETQITQTVGEAYEDFEENNNSDLDNSQGDEDNAQHEGNTQQTFDEIVFDSDIYHDMAPSEFEDVSKASTYHTAVDNRTKISEDPLCKPCLISTNRTTTTKSYALNVKQTKGRQRQHEKLELQSPKPIIEKAIEEIPQGDGKKGPKRCPTPPAQTKRVKKENLKKQPVILEGAERSYERLLSDAELDRYASELLIGKEFEFCTECQAKACTCYTALSSPPRSAGDKSKSAKTRTMTNTTNQIPNIEAVKKKTSQKTKEMLTLLKEKQITGIPVKQGSRPMSPSNKLRLSSSGSTPSKPNRIPISNSASFTMQGSVNVRNVKPSPAVVVVRTPNEGLTREERHEINKQKLKTVLNNKAQILQFELANTMNMAPPRIKKTKNCTKRSSSPTSQPSLSSIPNAKAIISEAKKPKQTAEKKTATTTTYKVQQKDNDDFICGRKHNKQQSRLRKLSSESIILSDKEDSPGNAFCTDSDINDDVYDAEHQKQINLSNNRGISPKSSRNDLTTSKRPSYNSIPKKSSNNISEIPPEIYASKERLIVTVPIKKKKESRNKPFRQARNYSLKGEEVVNITNYMPLLPRQLNYSDSNSNFSHTTGSSDIKSDKDYSPVQVYKIPHMIPFNPNQTKE